MMVVYAAILHSTGFYFYYYSGVGYDDKESQPFGKKKIPLDLPSRRDGRVISSCFLGVLGSYP